ncbi:hypothetical protein HJC23_002774 [Cyclotella cryptica]|uniref:Uncharacterized protein n=1 Tax=Cyclotella cryptica TaxID=29204 RepID=A0ABD3PEU2_9STRA|eukprot:CCRYP_015009-RA/>CCRYP_015009-RA protein AED:0.07 eAED:0.07 QI:140/1/1/1/0/0/3/380/148
MPQSQSSNLSSADVNTTSTMTEVVPTFQSEEDHVVVELDITTLTESAINSLRTDDPFMYYSIFKPTGNPAREVSDLLSTLESNESEQRLASQLVSRKSRISVEADFSTALLELMEEMPEIGGTNNEYQHLTMLGNDDEVQDDHLAENK